MNKNFIIKEIERQDIPECAEVIRASFKTVADEFGFTAENAPRFVAFATTPERLYYHFDVEKRYMVGCYYQDTVVGYFSLLFDGDECELCNLCVLPQYRHDGIGETLLSRAFDTAYKRGCRKVNIGIVEENTVLKRWYERYGFVRTGSVKYDFFPFICGYMSKEFSDREITVRSWFRAWVDNNSDTVCNLFSKKITYTECYGPVYKGIGQILSWFSDWNRTGRVTEWRIKRVSESGDTMCAEWFFRCEINGKSDCFDGVSVIDFEKDKIVRLSEYSSKAEHYCPYGE